MLSQFRRERPVRLVQPVRRVLVRRAPEQPERPEPEQPVPEQPERPLAEPLRNRRQPVVALLRNR
ncbi:hypothetical protein [Nocardia altamirensis]|uniref:hypothetical protein n=1 Tax=Nocardia altamirensis TaxID=472158 RepID=UPI00114CA38B|nr:hypothetical protein [Nocardia altamirensis]